MMTLIWAVPTALLGLAIGSFLNVVIYRVPAGESVVSPPSRCPSCGNGIRNRHNIPVLGWLILRGKCFDCGNPVSVQYPIVEALTGILFATVTLRLVALHQSWAVPAFLYFVAIGVALGAIDLKHKRLPDKIVLPSYPVVAALLVLAAAEQGGWGALARAGIGAAGLFAFYYVIMFAYPAGMGYGDVKLSGILGGLLAYLSWSTLAVGAFGGFLLGSVGGVAVLAAGRGSRKTAIPFGPFMIAGVILAVFIAKPVAHAYHQLLVTR